MLTQADLRPDQLLIRKIRRLANAALHNDNDEDEDEDEGYVIDDSIVERKKKKMRASTVETGGKFRVELKDEEDDDDQGEDGDGGQGAGGQGRSGRRRARISALNDDEIYD